MPTKPRSVVVTAEVVSALSLKAIRALVDAGLQHDGIAVRQIQANVIDQTKRSSTKKPLR